MSYIPKPGDYFKIATTGFLKGESGVMRATAVQPTVLIDYVTAEGKRVYNHKLDTDRERSEEFVPARPDEIKRFNDTLTATANRLLKLAENTTS